MRTIGVIDLMSGRAVHGVAGRRREYRPIERVAGTAIAPGDAVALGAAYLRRGVSELYTADLDAIGGGAPQDSLVRSIAALGAPLWLDAGVSSLERARRAFALGVSRVIVGLETLTSFDRLGDICDALGQPRVAFSLDLRHGQPVAPADLIERDEPPASLAARAVSAGADAVIVLDLGRVGTSLGIDFGLVETLRRQVANASLIVGGGIRGLADLQRLAALGCDGALVATALLEGRISET